MKTTIELPDPLLRRAKAAAAERGQSLKDLFIEALSERLDGPATQAASAKPPWMQGFGRLKRLRAETVRVQADIDAAFGVIEAEDRA